MARFGGRKWSEMDLNAAAADEVATDIYHAAQAAMVDNFRKDEKQMAALRLHCQLRTQRRREQFILCNLAGEQQPVVIEHRSYPEGALLIQFGLCGIGAPTPMSCMFCAYGHMTECHFPLDCRTARCEHVMRYIANSTPAATERVQ